MARFFCRLSRNKATYFATFLSWVSGSLFCIAFVSEMRYTDQAGRSISVSDVVPKAGLSIRRLRNLHQRQKARFGRMVRGCAHHRAPAALYRTVPAERLQAFSSLKCGFSIRRKEVPLLS